MRWLRERERGVEPDAKRASSSSSSAARAGGRVSRRLRGVSRLRVREREVDEAALAGAPVRRRRDVTRRRELAGGRERREARGGGPAGERERDARGGGRGAPRERARVDAAARDARVRPRGGGETPEAGERDRDARAGEGKVELQTTSSLRPPPLPNNDEGEDKRQHVCAGTRYLSTT